MYRLFIAPALAYAVFSSAASFAGDYESAFPYEVQSVAADTPLRCGPGDGFYVTEKLSSGYSLTVYRQSPGGWLAVRPTKASYSLLAARYGRGTQEQDVVEVVDDHAVSWIGTTATEPHEFKWQVRFKPGEKVVVLGEETRRAYPGGPRELHYRIAPPSGEFRWVHEQDVRHASQVTMDKPAAPGNIELTNFRVIVAEGDAEPDTGNPRRDEFVARQPHGVRSKSIASTRDTEVTSSRDNAEDSPEPPRRRRAPRESVAMQADRSPLDATDFDRQLRDLDLELSLMVAQPVEDWRLATLVKDVNALNARGPTTVERGRAQLLAEKLDAFEQLQARYRTARAGARSAGAGTTRGGAGAANAPQEPSRTAGVDPRFDGSGWLYPVHSRNQASPPYALLSADGAILQFVSPAPGLNLHRYLRKEIGVFGQQSASSRLNKPHVTAERVVSLARHRR